MTILAVSGIDTGIGKTVVTGLLARFLLERGFSVMTMKLVQTGCSGRAEDIILHRGLMGIPLQEEDATGLSCPYCFPFPASPHLAARLAGTVIEPQRLVDCVTALTSRDILIIESAGGLMAPLTGEKTQLDFLAGQGWPLLLVSSPRLGSINHTLLSLEAIKSRRMTLLGLVYNLHQESSPEITADTRLVFHRALRSHGFPDHLIDCPGMDSGLRASWETLLPAL